MLQQMYEYWCWRNVAGIVTCLAIYTGCAPSARVVEGKITLDGKALTNGAIEFQPMDSHRGKPLGGEINDGNYRIQIPRNEAVGKSVVHITSMQATGRKIQAGTPAPRGTMIDEIAEVVPSQFNTNSKLQVDLDGAGPFDFALSSTKTK